MNIESYSPFLNDTEIQNDELTLESSDEQNNEVLPDPKENFYPYVEQANFELTEEIPASTKNYFSRNLFALTNPPVQTENVPGENFSPFPDKEDINDESMAETENNFSDHEGVENEFPEPSTVIAVSENLALTKKNELAVEKSGVAIDKIYGELRKQIDIPAIQKYFIEFNKANPSSTYLVNDSTTNKVDSVFTEAIHQFQLRNYLEPNESDGWLGRSALETLGIFNHKLKSKIFSTDGLSQLNAISGKIYTETNNVYTAANWYDHIVKPAWLGVKISDGIHVLLLEKLKQAEEWLLSQPAYSGMSPVELGRALGLKPSSRYSAGRFSAPKQGMHGMGLAIDIDVWGNPWLGAGWLTDENDKLNERKRLLTALQKASGEKLPGSNIFEYLNYVGENYGDDTREAYQVLKNRNDEFIAYLKSNDSELKFWQHTATFDKRDPRDGFLNLHPDLVYALRQVAELAWGAIDFGPLASGDVMHFDLRTVGVGITICKQLHGAKPKKGHPSLLTKEVNDMNYEDISEEKFFVDGIESDRENYSPELGGTSVGICRSK